MSLMSASTATRHDWMCLWTTNLLNLWVSCNSRAVNWVTDSFSSKSNSVLSTLPSQSNMLCGEGHQTCEPLPYIYSFQIFLWRLFKSFTTQNCSRLQH